MTQQHWKLGARQRSPSPAWGEDFFPLLGCRDICGTGIHTNRFLFLSSLIIRPSFQAVV